MEQFLVIENMNKIFGVINAKSLEDADCIMIDGFMSETDWNCDGEYFLTHFDNIVSIPKNGLKILNQSLIKTLRYKSVDF